MPRLRKLKSTISDWTIRTPFEIKDVFLYVIMRAKEVLFLSGTGNDFIPIDLLNIESRTKQLHINAENSI